MFRRSRFSVRPNVSTAVRPASTPQEAPAANQEASEAPRETGERNNAAALTDKPNVTLTEKAAASGDGSDQNVDGTCSTVQRRKRFSVKPKVAPGRSSTLSRTPKSPVKAASQSSVECSGSDLEKPTTSSQTGTTATPKGLQSPRRRRPSEDIKQPKMQHKPTSISLDTSEPSAVSPAVHSVEQTHLPADSSKQSENISDRQVKEAPPRPPDRPSLPDKESTELSEKAKTLVTSKSVLSLTPSALSLSRLLNDPSDLKRLVKAQKLRELLKEERRKEKKLKKAKEFPKVIHLDPAKMPIRDVIHFFPLFNPVISSLVDSTQENETVVPPSPGTGASPKQAQEPEVPLNTVSKREGEEEADEVQEVALMVPQVKVAKNGSLIIDEESLTVEVQRAKGPNPAEDRDPIFERGSTTTYASFRKSNRAKHWSSEETDMFFLAISMVGTDFSMIGQLFPHRSRLEIKNKFKKEERENSWRIDKAIKKRRTLDREYFSKLLEKILEYQKSKKKLRSLREKNSSKKGKKATEARKSASKLSDVEEEDEEDENEVLDLVEEEGEKENEDLCDDGDIPVSEAKTKRGKRKKSQTALDEEPNDKRNKRVSTEQGEDGVPEDTEAGLPQSHRDSDMCTFVKMFRRSRFSVRPNVSTAVRPASTPQEAPTANQEASEAPRETGERNNAAALTDKPNVTLTEKAAALGDGSDQNVDGTSSTVQRRKRFSVKPKVAPGRSSTLSRTPKSPVKAASQSSVECSGSDLEKPTTSSQTGTTATPKGLQSPRRRRPSEDIKQPKMQHKPTSISLDTSEPSAVSPAVHSVEQTHLPADSSKQSENISDRQVKEAPPRPPDRPSLPDKESTELSEKAKTLVTSKSVLSLTPSALSLSRLLNDPSDLKRLVKAQKLRELLKEERRKEKKLKKAKEFSKVIHLDPAKMTMRDLIHYLPMSNPMTSSLVDSTQENETVVPPSPGTGASPKQAQEPEVPLNTVSNREEEEEEEADEEQEEALMVPQVKVAEDGSLIIDEESLTVEVQRAKGPNPAENRDPIFERGSTTTYSSFRKLNHAKRWTSEETDMFFLAVSMVGTDFSMICQLFPHRARSEIKNKFKKEERENSWRVDKAIRERRKLDIEYFSKLLEKILEYQKSKKKLRSLREKNSSKKGKKATKARKSASKLSDVEEEDEEDENEVLDLVEEEGEKENEDLCDDGDIPVSEAKTKRGKRKKSQTALDEEPNDKRNKRVSTEQGEDGVPEDTEAGLPQSHRDSDMSEKTQNVNTAAVKPAKLSRGRAPKPLLPLGCKWSKKPAPCTTAENTSSDKEEESVNKDASSLSHARVELADDDISSEEEDVIVKPPRPTRCGRVPKPTKPLTYPAKEEVRSSASEATPSTASAAKPKSKQAAKRRVSPQPDSAPKSKKSKLVTLTASQTEFSDDEGHQWQDEEVEEVELAGSPSKDSSAPVFVPAGLHTPRPQIKEVDETIAELDILATMPDVLGISQDALCPDSACEQAQHETGSAEPCEHQLDLLIDVIEFISSEHAEEVSDDQSYNEAAQTLLTIGNLTHVSQLAQDQIIIPDHVTAAGDASAGVNETSHLEKELTSKPAVQEKSATPSVSTFGQDITQTSETVATAEQQDSITDSGEMSIVKTGDEPNPESSNKNTPQSKRGRFSKVKPKPNLGRSSRTAQPKSQSEISAVRTAEESHTVPPNITDCSPAMLKSDISSAEVQLTVEPSGSQPDVDGVESGAATSEIQSHCSSVSQFESSMDQATRETKTLFGPTDEKLGSPVETAEIGFKDAPNSDSFIPEIEQESCSNLPPAKESGDKRPLCVSPAEDLSVTQKGESEATNTCQFRRSQLQKVEPKPNLSQTSRTVSSKPQTTTQPEERDLKKAIAEPTCSTSVEQCQSSDPDSVKPLLNLGSALPLPEELSTNEEKKSGAGPQQSIQENQNSESQFEHSEQPASNTGSASDFTVEKMTSHVRTTKSSCDKVVTSDSAVTVSQVGRGANVDSAPVKEGSDRPPVFPTSADELPVNQKEGEVVSTSQMRRTRLPKLKPKPNLPQTSRTAKFKPETQKQPEERDPVPTQDPRFHKPTVVDPQPHSSRTSSPEQQSQSEDSAAVLKPTLDLDSTLIPREELSANEKSTDHGVDVGAVISDCSVPEYQSSESQFELRKHQVTDTKKSFEPTEDKVKSYVGTAKTVIDNSATSDLVVTEVERESCTDLDRGQESTEKPPPCVSPAEDLPVRQKGVSEVTAACQSRRSRMQKVKPKPNLAQTSRISRCKPQTTKQAVEKDTNSTQNTSLPETTISDVEPQPAHTSSSEKQSENTDPASGLKPSVNVVSSLTLLEEPSANEEKKTNVRPDLGAATSDQSAPENQNLSESQVELSMDQVIGDTKSSSEPEKNVPGVGTAESSCKDVVTPDSAVAVSQAGKDPVIHMQVEEKSCSQTCAPESTDYKTKDVEAQPSCSPNFPEKSKSPDTGSVSEPSLELGSTHKYTEEFSSTEKEKTDVVCGPVSSSVSLEQNVPQRSRRFPKVKPKPNLGSSTRTARTKLQPADIPESAQHCNVDTISNIASGQQPGDNNNARTPVKVPEKDLPSGHCSLNAEVCSALDTSNSKESHPSDPDSSLGCLAQVNEQQSEHDSPTNNSQVPLVCVTEGPSTQNESSTKDIQSYPIFQDMLPEQVPSDPDEPFFILSLTEIPLSSSGELVHSAIEYPSGFSVTESSIPQPSSVSGESVAAAGEGSLSNVSIPVFTLKKGEMGLDNVKDTEPGPSALIGHTMEETVDPHESTTDHPPKFPDTVGSNETEIPLTKPRHTDTGRKAKPQVKSSSVRRKQTSKTLSAEAAESAPTHTITTQDLTHSMPSVEPKPYDAITDPQIGNYSLDEDILTDGNGTNSSLEAQSSRSRESTCQRKPRDSLSSLPVTNKIAPSQNLPPGKPASKRSKVKTPLAEGKQSLLKPVASTSHDVDSTQILAQPLKETHPTSTTLLTQTAVEVEQTTGRLDPAPSALQCTDEQSDCMDSSFLDEEPTGVSQYFLSDIFTEVEEG
ncbi:transcription factor TFIIIB component B'' homolog [Archocentrus centrarchus]|uniref:transcription factor TFIIIB component B'' homolog n=1 Tax=Archocentrus centrarchus TaxID=63155 RepID=UPI0011E9F5CF|nr:transcription factor TFIIIB component B'' homolog [Archocentrus centrarchus]